jgi:hypothetical protein
MRSVWKRSLAIVLLTLVTAWALCVCSNGLLAQPLSKIGTLQHVPCNPRVNPACPDFTSFAPVGSSWQPPKPGFRGLVMAEVERSARLQRDILIFFFKPDTAESDHEAVQAQALAILRHLEASRHLTVNLSVGKAYWYDGRVVQLDNYIFAKDGSHRWQRIHDAKLVDQIIGEGH